MLLVLKVGFPQALLYYHYYPMWKVFFQELGACPVVSSPTSKRILDWGVKKTVDEACLPIKVYFGHILDLAEKVDFIFLPRLVSVAPKEYICPKFLGLPDMVKQSVPGLPPLITTNINLYHSQKDLGKQFYQTGKLFTKNPLRLWLVFKRALLTLKKYQKLLEYGLEPEVAMAETGKKIIRNSKRDREKDYKLTVALIGHPYNIYDPYVNLNVIKKLKQSQVNVLTPDHLPEKIIQQEAEKLPKKLFWTMAKRMIGSAFHYLNLPGIDGLIYLGTFGCGPDSITGEIIQQKVKQLGRVPFLNITLDEHSGEAGMITRLEAFLDMIYLRKAASA